MKKMSILFVWDTLLLFFWIVLFGIFGKVSYPLGVLGDTRDWANAIYSCSSRKMRRATRIFSV
jgi:hypothetical protein